jgi:signal transduction histidine kinase
VSRRIAYVVISVVFANFLGNAFFYVLQGGITPGRIAGSLALLLAIGYLQLRVFSRPGAAPRSPTGYLALGAMAALVYAPVPLFEIAWLGMPGFLAGSALLVLPMRIRWPVFAAVVLGNGLVQAPYYPGGFSPYLVILTLVSGLVVFGMSRLPALVEELERARSELADLAVTEERLRFARDLHDVLGFSLSAITLKVELTRKLIGEHTERAVRELSEILGISRQALNDVRAVASSYRELSLTDEISSARSVLSAAGVQARVEADHGELSPRSRTVLATVLREGVTNLLRDSRATSCTITITGQDRVSLDIVNDGACEPANTDLTTLSARVAAIGGTLLAESSPEGTYRLRAEVPAQPDLEQPGEEPRPAGPAMATRFAHVLLTTVVVGYGLTAMTMALMWRPVNGALGTVVAIVSSAITVALVLGFFSRPHAPLRSARAVVAFALLAVCVYVPDLALHNAYIVLPGFLAGCLALALPPRWAWPAFAAVVAGQIAIVTAEGGTFVDIGWTAMSTTNHGLVLYALTRLRSMVIELHDARQELATAAVTQERLRFARDLHDLLGYSLSAITLKSELTHRLVTVEPERARQELTEVLDISRQALADVRSVALSYRELSFDEETESAQALLSAADINVTVRLEPCEMPKDVRVTLATVLREGVTNLLRHSKAENCAITLACCSGRVTMDIVNDGVPESARARAGGSGIGNLTTRVRALGGDLTTGVDDERMFRLRAEIPLG